MCVDVSRDFLEFPSEAVFNSEKVIWRRVILIRSEVKQNDSHRLSNFCERNGSEFDHLQSRLVFVKESVLNQDLNLRLRITWMRSYIHALPCCSPPSRKKCSVLSSFWLLYSPPLSRFLLVTPAIEITKKIFSKNMSTNFLSKSIKINVMKQWKVNQTEKSEIEKVVGKERRQMSWVRKAPDVVGEKGREQRNCHLFDTFISQLHWCPDWTLSA